MDTQYPTLHHRVGLLGPSEWLVRQAQRLDLLFIIKWSQSHVAAFSGLSLVASYSDHFFTDDHFHALVERWGDNAEIMEPLSPYNNVVGRKRVDKLESSIVVTW